MFGLLALLAFAAGIALLAGLIALLAWMYRRLSASADASTAVAVTLGVGLVLYLLPSYRAIADVATIRKRCADPNVVVSHPVGGVNAVRLSGSMSQNFEYDKTYRFLERVEYGGELKQRDLAAQGRCRTNFCTVDQLVSQYQLHFTEQDVGSNLRMYEQVITEVEGGRVLGKAQWFERIEGHAFPYNAAFAPWELWQLVYDAPERCTDTLGLQRFVQSVLVPAKPEGFQK